MSSRFLLGALCAVVTITIWAGWLVVMRVGMVVLWARAARHDPARRRIAATYVSTISASQIGWVLLFFAQLPDHIRSYLLAPPDGLQRLLTRNTCRQSVPASE